MKHIYSLALFCIMLCSCNQNPKHPQADLINQEASTNMDERSILRYADSIDNNLTNLDKHVSLVYDDQSKTMFVEQYSQFGKPLLYIEHIDEAAVATSLRKFYFKSDSLILVKEHMVTTTQAGGQLISDTQSYLRNNTLFNIKMRKAGNESELKSLPFADTGTADQKSINYREMVKTLAAAAHGHNEYEMIFDHLANYSNAEYIVLKSKEQNNYTANVLIKERDALIDSLGTSAPLFKDKELNFTWKVENKEAVYVPVEVVSETSETSARGLKR